MAKAASYIPEGIHTVTPYLTIKGAAQAIEFYKQAFGATEVMRMPGPQGEIVHAQIRIGNSAIFLSEELMGAKSPATLGGTPVVLHTYVPDCDATFQQAVTAGARVLVPLADMFWGDRYGVVADPYGHQWAITTVKEDLTPQEVAERGKAAMQPSSKG